MEIQTMTENNIYISSFGSLFLLLMPTKYICIKN
jgi:hypothetical protein